MKMERYFIEMLPRAGRWKVIGAKSLEMGDTVSDAASEGLGMGIGVVDWRSEAVLIALSELEDEMQIVV